MDLAIWLIPAQVSTTKPDKSQLASNGISLIGQVWMMRSSVLQDQTDFDMQ